MEKNTKFQKKIVFLFTKKMKEDICEIYDDKILYYEQRGWDTINYKLMKSKTLKKLDENISILNEKEKR
jgi:hypothetical protein